MVVRVDSDYVDDPAVSTEIRYDVELWGDSDEALRSLAEYVDRIAEIPNSIRNGTAVTLGSVSIATNAGS